MSVFVKDGGVWKESGSGGLSVKDSNAWKAVDTGYVKDGGVWKPFYVNLTYWLSLNTNARSGTGKPGFDSSGALYVPGQQSGADVSFYKLAANGTLAIARQIDAPNTFFNSSAVDSSGNIYLAGLNILSSQVVPFIAKYNSSGTILAQKKLSQSGNFNSRFRNLDIDSSGNLILATDFVDAAFVSNPIIFKFDSSLNLIFQKEFVGPNSSNNGYLTGAGAIDGSGNIIQVSKNNSNDYLNVVKYTNAGAISFAIQVNNRSSSISSEIPQDAVATDSSNNIYVIENLRESFVWGVVVYKFNSSGGVVWQQRITVSGDYYGNAIAVDKSTGNVFVTLGNFSNRWILLCLTSAGNFNFARELFYNSGSIKNDFIVNTNSTNSLYLVGTRDGSFDIISAKLPLDGSGTGTYGLFSYTSVASSVFTFAARSYTFSSVSASVANTSITLSNTSQAESAASTSQVLNVIP